MKARVSGRAAAYAVKRANGWEIGRRGCPGLVKAELLDVNRTLGTTPDVVEMEAKNVAEVERRLESEWAKDRALRLCIILLEPNEPDEGLEAVATLLETLLTREHVVEHLENQFYQQELPENAALARALVLATGLQSLSGLLNHLVDRQQAIRRVSDSFDALPEDLFGGLPEKAAYREHAINAGAFRSLVLSSNDGALGGAAIFDLHEKLHDAPNARAVVQAWTAAFDRIVTELPPLPADIAEDFERDVADFGGGPGGRERLRNALEQQSAILGRVAAGDYDTAKRFARELEQQQLATAGPSYLAKSMTRLSQGAREMEAFELALEWAFAAVEYQPDDARTRTQYADALLHADRIEEALEQFARAAELGERAYAATGSARAMRALGKFEDELRLFEEAATVFSNTREEIYALVGIATAKQDLGDNDGAVRQLEDAIAKHPYEPLPRLSLGSMLLNQGRFEDAQNNFEEAEKLSSENVAAANGLADLCRRIGRLDEARQRYAHTANRHPRDINAHIGLIDTLRSLGEREKASMYARRTAERFPGSPRAAIKHAETASELGRHVQARQVLKEAIARFPKDSRLLLARTNAYRREGRYDSALQTIDAAVARFPYNPRPKRLRAEILRRLKHLDASEAAYRSLVEADKYDVRARNGLASILIFRERGVEARELISNDNPRTADEWRSFFLIASLLDSEGDVEGARQRFEWALANCPFAAERRLFACALASQAARLGRARKAPRIVPNAERDIGNVIDFQIAAMTRRARAKNAYSSLTRNLPPRYAPLRDEIAKTYGIVSGRPQHSKAWIYRQMRDELLLAAA